MKRNTRTRTITTTAATTKTSDCAPSLSSETSSPKIWLKPAFLSRAGPPSAGFASAALHSPPQSNFAEAQQVALPQHLLLFCLESLTFGAWWMFRMERNQDESFVPTHLQSTKKRLKVFSATSWMLPHQSYTEIYIFFSFRWKALERTPFLVSFLTSPNEKCGLTGRYEGL